VLQINCRPTGYDDIGSKRMCLFCTGSFNAFKSSMSRRDFVAQATSAVAATVLGSAAVPEACLGYWVAAVRELFEEAGIHFFQQQDSELTAVTARVLSARLAHKRAELQQGKFDLPTLMADERLCCDVGRLSYFFHRITPEHYPVRFDTRFYLAALPEGQTPLHSSEEVSESVWVSPKTALERAQGGNFPMMPPTIAVLRTLAEHGSWNSLRDAFQLR